ncbi:MAG TPA: hypothetical protein ENN51_08655, partial [candidate division WOR-3 bacterium]|nr:hypothetical protein [candidate division WOR-3 bacterium]
MSKYEEICAAYAKARSFWEEQRKHCREFATDLAAKLVADLEVPPEDIIYLPPNVEYHPREVRPIEEALSYGADGAFHYGLGLRVRAAADNPMTEVLVLQISVARNPGGYELRIEGLNDPIRIPHKLDEMSKGHRAFLDTYSKRAVST